MTLTVVLVALALVGGLVGHRLIARSAKRREEPAAEGISITDIANVVPTMCVLLLAFIMVATFDSWKTAGTTADAEAMATVSQARAARFLPADGGAPIARSLVCYARAVITIEWDTMGDGHASTVPDYWEDRVNLDIQDSRKADEDAAFNLLAIDHERLANREVRLEQSLSSVPGPMTWLMILSVVLSVLFLSVLTDVSIGRPVQLATLLGATLLLTGSLLLIEEMDSPYSGPTKVEPVAMARAEETLVEELAEYTSRTPPPCDKQGMPTSNGSFEAETEAIV